MSKKIHREIVKPQFAVTRSIGGAQRGFLMISMLIVVAATGALLALYVEREMERARLDRGEQIGYALSVLGEGFNRYLNDHRLALAADKPHIPFVANPLQPTAEELIRTMNIPGIAPKPPFIADSSYRFTITYPPGCTAKRRIDAPGCRATGLAYIDKPPKRGTGADYVALAQAVRVMKGRGGYARPESAWQFTFPDSAAAPASRPITNPTRVAGVLAWRAEIRPGQTERLRIDGGNRMDGVLRLDGRGVDHDLIGSRNIEASGLLSAGRATVLEKLSVGGELQVLGGSPGLKPSVTVEKDATVKGDAAVAGTTTTGTFYFSRSYRQGAPCSMPDALASDGEGQVVQCDETWRSIETKNLVHTSVIRVPSGPIESFKKYTLFLGNYIFCTTSLRTGRFADKKAKYDAERRSWTVSVYGGRDPINVRCYGPLPP